MSCSILNPNRQIQNKTQGQLKFNESYNKDNNFLGKKRGNSQDFPRKKHYKIEANREKKINKMYDTIAFWSVKLV